jgi:cytochrome c oxidase subunit I+III
MTSVTIGLPEPHTEDPNHIGRRWRTGVVLLIVADGAFVASLVFTYFYLRGLNTQKAWVAPDQTTAAIWASWLITGVLVLSAVVYRLAARAIQAGNEARFVGATALALLLLAIDVVIQVIQLVTFPFGIDTSAYSSTVYAMAGANLFHLLLTVFLAVSMVNRGRAHIYSATSNWQVRLVGLWWAWVAAAAILTAFASSFVASPNH